MKKKNFITGALALTILFNTTGCSIQKTDHISSQSIVEMSENTYELDGIYVATKTLITKEEELVLITEFLYRDIFSNYKYNENEINKDSIVPLIEYLTLNELKESYTFEELKLILQRLREDFHGVSYNPNIPFPYEAFTEERNEKDTTYYADKIKLSLVKNEKNEDYEIYLSYPNSKILNTHLGNSEFFTNVNLGSKVIKTFPVNDFIPTNLIKNAYTENELKALLAYVREIYHSNTTLYEEANKLELTD